MTSRLDRLLLLLDTGSTSSVRTTAAKQLAQLAAKSVIGDVSIVEEDVKTNRQHTYLADQSAWSELMAVVARILPCLHSRSYETRSAASTALSQVFSLVPLWQPGADVDSTRDVSVHPPPEFPPFSVCELMEKGTLLLASSGKEFVKPTGILASSSEVKKARKEAMGRLGLDFLDGFSGDDDMDIEKELVADEADQDVEMETAPKIEEESAKRAFAPARSGTSTPVMPQPVSQDVVMADDSALSARERNRLKRKRKPGNNAFVAAPAPPAQGAGAKYNAAPVGQSKARLIAADEQSSTAGKGSEKSPRDTASQEKVVIDPSKGGAVSPKAQKQSKALEVPQGRWVWDGLAKVLEVDLFSPAWEVRHGAAMALRELLKLQGKYGGMQVGLSWEDNLLAHERWCNELAVQFLCIFVLDRFGDFVSDQVVAPVRETVSQTLASLLLHMPRRSVLRVHSILLHMIRQDFQVPVKPIISKTRGPDRNTDKSHIWEVRHAGLLGIKYEVAVRSDLVSAAKSEDGQDLLRGVVDAAVLGLGDRDDDVRSVAASCLLPVAAHLVGRLPEELPRVLAVLWSCLSDMKDDLSSSVGAVMDLLGELHPVHQPVMVADNNLREAGHLHPITMLAPTLFPFFRHTIANVRLAVVNTLQTFMTVTSLPKEWMTLPYLRLLYQNLIVEERGDIRHATLTAWRLVLSIISSVTGWLESLATQQVLLEWYAVLMTPLGLPLDASAFHDATAAMEQDGVSERHNVDKNMLAQDLALIPVETVLKARVAAAAALAHVIASWDNNGSSLDDTFRPILVHYSSRRNGPRYDAKLGPSAPLLMEKSSLASEISEKTLSWLQAEPPAAVLQLLQSFAYDCKLPQSSIPVLGTEVDITDTKSGCFTIQTAHAAVGEMFDKLKATGTRIIKEKRVKVVASIERYVEVKAQYDIRVSAAFAAAFVAFKGTPDKVSPIVKGIMNSIKNEDNVDLQTRSAVAVAAFVEFCVSREIAQPPDKIVKNLCTFLCQDTDQTPTFAYARKTLVGILSFPKSASHSNAKEEKSPPSPEDAARAYLSRRGAQLAFVELSKKFGARLLDAVPKMWQSMAGGLVSACSTDDLEKMDKQIEKQSGQDVIDSFSVLEAIVPTFHESLWPKFREVFPMIILALRSRFAIIRQAAAKCFATMCDTMTMDAMRAVIETVIPFLGDDLNLSNRQGSTELMYHIVQKLDMKALPYVIFMVVPVLGRMSDPDDDIRATATNTFASLVKMVPLEAGLPAPPGFSQELLQRRDSERQFLMQLLDGSKVQQYNIPVTIKAELRKYQQEGVNWLAFLAKYQLHGILCDDMGLGKTLQSICILASKHHERAKKHEEMKSPDSVHLPSLIVCPPTLTGHWYYEILKYTDNLKPVTYTGNSRERSKLLSRLKKFDVVITSYEVVRNDISSLEDINWHYCILDEGHIIKNAKTKLTKAVKCIRAHHRLILSGTPIQNNVLELWSFETSFNERFSKPILSNRDGKSKNGEAAALALEALHKQVLPFLLRRLKEDVLNDLPPKIIQDYYCELSDLQKYLYDDFSRSRAGAAAEDVVRSDKGQSGDQQHVFQSLQYLRKLCNHPALVLKDKQSILDALAHAGQKAGLSDIHNAPKLLALKQLLVDCGIGVGSSVSGEIAKSELADAEPTTSGAFSQHRVLIFCQMKQMLDIIEKDLFKPHMPSVTYMRLDGNTDANKRHAVVQTFNSDPSIDCLLLTTHVGGLGLTLTGADTVIFVEHDWNPMKDLQAMDRAHRIGQKKVVNVYRLITKGTLEEKIMGLQRFKLNIANSVVTQQNSGLSSMDTDLVLDLFRHTTEAEESTSAMKKNEKEPHALPGQRNVLKGLEDLPPEEEYEGLDLSSFMGSLERQ
ncbi:SNF2 chromatin remodeling protein [Fomitopsis serialis]|uniref:SNF2 chromatin remodeling protein n=1 Tax=Fomitopsis serialis TaxID=139415 RepID=UPI002008560F|nr:SNF2 chromatin remodeling protein [Neoantrodia serialis]KAH9934987.1 SNF2 chromatin remodeling protein [Neoantrodia serialis]